MEVVNTHVETHLAVIFAAVIQDTCFWKTIQHVKVANSNVTSLCRSYLVFVECIYIAQSCPLLEAPSYGYMDCDKQTVGGTLKPCPNKMTQNGVLWDIVLLQRRHCQCNTCRPHTVSLHATGLESAKVYII